MDSMPPTSRVAVFMPRSSHSSRPTLLRSYRPTGEPVVLDGPAATRRPHGLGRHPVLVMVVVEKVRGFSLTSAATVLGPAGAEVRTFEVQYHGLRAGALNRHRNRVVAG